MKLIYQLVGDRDRPTAAFRFDYANCVAANPMSDRCQLCVEVYELC